MDDKGIIDLYFARDEKAISETMKSYNGHLYRFALRFLSDPRDAEECVNDAYVRAWDTIPPNRPNNLFAYLAALCRNAALDVIKKNSAQKRSAQLVELTQEMNECIPDSNITEDMEAILSLHTGRTPEEISEITKTDHYFTAQEAVDFGLADAVKDFSAMLKEGGIA